MTTCENHRSQQECRVQLPRHKSSISTQPVHQQLVRRICCTSASLRSKDLMPATPSALLLATSPPGRGHMIAQPSSCPNQSCRKSFSVVRVLSFAPDTSAAGQVSRAAGRGGWCPGQPSSKLRKSYKQGQVLNIKAARARVRRCKSYCTQLWSWTPPAAALPPPAAAVTGSLLHVGCCCCAAVGDGTSAGVPPRLSPFDVEALLLAAGDAAFNVVGEAVHGAHRGHDQLWLPRICDSGQQKASALNT